MRGDPEKVRVINQARKDAGDLFVQALRGLERYAGVSRLCLSGLLGVSRQTTWRWLDGRSRPKSRVEAEDLAYDATTLYRMMRRVNWHEIRPPPGVRRDLLLEKKAAEEGWRTTHNHHTRGELGARKRMRFTWRPPVDAAS